ncbi:CBS domain-containing protein [Rhizobium tumorigenes]|uniref:CBS domain-containing protein n=1 Tax=Rhizobium tumorigenes TaxID=2041385 RepID=UPI00241EDE39|nr:CBS domain-containing protein [Rhizobium tumorigenes]WFS00406.1 CBS domain-containing protein [Rhizobium tumorigenes]
MLAKNVMTTSVISIQPTASVRSAALSMIAHSISGLPVVDDDGLMIGIVTEGDLLRRVAVRAQDRHYDLPGPNDPPSLDDYVHTHGWSVRDAMCSDIIKAGPDTDVREIAGIMLSHGIKRVPILDKGQLIGIVSRCDLLGMIIDAPFDIVASGDEAIRLAISTRLQDDLGIDPAHVEVTVSGARVSVGGRLETDLQQKAIRVLVESVHGVTGYTDHTTLTD